MNYRVVIEIDVVDSTHPAVALQTVCQMLNTTEGVLIDAADGCRVNATTVTITPFKSDGSLSKAKYKLASGGKIEGIPAEPKPITVELQLSGFTKSCVILDGNTRIEAMKKASVNKSGFAIPAIDRITMADVVLRFLKCSTPGQWSMLVEDTQGMRIL